MPEIVYYPYQFQCHDCGRRWYGNWSPDRTVCPGCGRTAHITLKHATRREEERA